LKNRDTFEDRLEAQAKARAALLEKAKQKDPTNDPEFAARQQARLEAARQREERDAERRRIKAAERERERAERAQRAAAKAEEERRAAEEARRAAEEAKAAAAVAERDAARKRRNVKPASLGLADLKAALEAQAK
jgi:colicin import membrane protein